MAGMLRLLRLRQIWYGAYRIQRVPGKTSTCATPVRERLPVAIQVRSVWLSRTRLTFRLHPTPGLRCPQSARTATTWCSCRPQQISLLQVQGATPRSFCLRQDFEFNMGHSLQPEPTYPQSRVFGKFGFSNFPITRFLGISARS